MEFTVSNTVFEWRGPSPYYFVAVDARRSEEIKEIASVYTYGWGVLYITIRKGDYTWVTVLIPKEDQYVIPLKAAVREQLKLNVGDKITLTVKLGR